jgi:hypothetical protein
VEIRNQSALNEAKEQVSEPIERTVRVLNLTDGVGVTKVDISVSAHTGC